MKHLTDNFNGSYFKAIISKFWLVFNVTLHKFSVLPQNCTTIVKIKSNNPYYKCFFSNHNPTLFIMVIIIQKNIPVKLQHIPMHKVSYFCGSIRKLLITYDFLNEIYDIGIISLHQEQYFDLVIIFLWCIHQWFPTV